MPPGKPPAGAKLDALYLKLSKGFSHPPALTHPPPRIKKVKVQCDKKPSPAELRIQLQEDITPKGPLILKHAAYKNNKFRSGPEGSEENRLGGIITFRRLSSPPSKSFRPLSQATHANYTTTPFVFRRIKLSSLPERATDPKNKFQIYISRSMDPYMNLSIEHYLLQSTPADSTVLFLYTNRPSIVLGRNQNPWVEVNLGLLRKHAEEKSGLSDIDLVRRRSGGGTVFHDEGNVNYCVICPTAAFDRDKHAEMVVRALRSLGVDKARVNARHDIVLHKSRGLKGSTRKGNQLEEFKISGSAYKLTRLRSLHHGTCLLSSPNIEHIGDYLKSPAKPWIQAKGVNSVRSPVTNVGIANESFEQAVTAEFRKMYDENVAVVELEESEAIAVPAIAKGLAEIKSPEWIYCQTPQFSFSTNPAEDFEQRDAEQGSEWIRKSAVLPEYLPPAFRASFTVRYGAITASRFEYMGDLSRLRYTALAEGAKLHEFNNWERVLNFEEDNMRVGEVKAISKWLNSLFGWSHQ